MQLVVRALRREVRRPQLRTRDLRTDGFDETQGGVAPGQRLIELAACAQHLSDFAQAFGLALRVPDGLFDAQRRLEVANRVRVVTLRELYVAEISEDARFPLPFLGGSRFAQRLLEVGSCPLELAVRLPELAEIAER